MREAGGGKVLIGACWRVERSSKGTIVSANQGKFLQTGIKERWLDVCSEAAISEDPKRLEELLREITAMLEAEKRRLRTAPVKHRTVP
jgi:hypothetical protein